MRFISILTGLALATGVIVAGYGGLRLGRAAQDAMARMWGVTRAERGSLLVRTVRGLALLGALGAAVLAGAVLRWVVVGNGHFGTPENPGPTRLSTVRFPTQRRLTLTELRNRCLEVAASAKNPPSKP